MSEHVHEVKLVTRRWDRQSGLTETEHVFPTLDALFNACVNVTSPELIDRLTIRGRDSNGRERTLNFVFQSVTVDPQ